MLKTVWIVNVGSEDNPADDPRIEKVRTDIRDVYSGPLLVLNHDVKIEIYEPEIHSDYTGIHPNHSDSLMKHED